MIETEEFLVEGLLLIKPKVFSDERGLFLETYHTEKYKEAGIPDFFVQDNESVSKALTLRGLHFQAPPFAQGKLVRVVSGSIYDVAVDIRQNSPTYGKAQAVMLSGENRFQFWIPIGFAHGFLALEDNTVVNYKCTSFYNTTSENTLLWNDADLAIDWPQKPLLISSKDLEGVRFNDFVTPFI